MVRPVRELTAAGLLQRDAQGAYELTELGAQLGDALAPLDAWARRWADSRAPRR